MYDCFAYKLGPFEFSLDDLETGILRCNYPHWETKQILFQSGDERNKLSLAGVPDPRIFFALNCGGKGGCAIKVYDPVSCLNIDRYQILIILLMKGNVNMYGKTCILKFLFCEKEHTITFIFL